MTKSFEELAETNVCSSCVQEVFLNGEINRTGKEATCSYCGATGKSWTLELVAESIHIVLRDHYELTAAGPTDLEYSMDYPWQQTGDSIDVVICELGGLSEVLTEDVRQFLSDLHSDPCDDDPYATDAHYKISDVGDEDPREAWGAFELTLKTTTRYFNRDGDKLLRHMFDNVDKRKNGDGVPVVVEVGPNKPIDSLFRARLFQSEAGLLRAMEMPGLELGPPPPCKATAGRMNADRIVVFYGAFEKQTAFREVRPHVGGLVLVGRFRLLRDLKLLDVDALRSVQVTEGSPLDPEHIVRLRHAKFLDVLRRRVSQLVQPSDTPLEYLATQAIADFLASQVNPEIDGLIYASSLGEGRNVVLFHKAAGVQATNRLLSARREWDEESELPYSVSKSVGPMERASRQTQVPYTSSSLVQPATAVDLSSLEVHEVFEVEPKARIYPVSYQQCEL